ncbi:MAG: redoxin domain-containing protein [Alphaproteobacteria bacterium]|nr:MAG: redoxin domain-containing protein [Alphaproteobacteria bacterium]
MKKLMLALVCLFLAVPAQAKDLEVGDMAPDYVGREDGKAKIYIKDFKGQYVVVTFFATWCAPCRAEVPILENIQRQVSPDVLKVIAVTYHENRETFKRIKRVFEDADTTLTFDGDGRVAMTYGVKAIPNMFIIDPEGKIAKIRLGYGPDSAQELVDDLNAVLGFGAPAGR